jgi:XRE family transcriptional regulator, regulator of sulfur utilization
MQEVPRKKERDRLGEVFGTTVRKLRESRGWTQEQLAEASEMSATYLGFIERGENVPTLPVIVRLAIALKVTPGFLLDDTWRRR